MKQVWKRISALLLACAVLAALIPAALAGNSSEAYKIAVSAAPAVVTAGSTTIVSATVYSCDEADGEWSEYLGGGADVVELRKVDVHGSLLAQARLLGELVCPRLDGLEQVLGGELALERVGVCVDIAQNALAGLEQLGDPGQRTL